jgi:hypothetical protein
MPVCSAVAYGVDHSVIVRLELVYEVQMRIPYGVELRNTRSGLGKPIVASRPRGYREKYSEWAW